VVAECPGVPPEILIPRSTWSDGKSYDAAAKKLADLFRTNFKSYEAGAEPETTAAGPRI
jgi:phosphoenolpyruvate carboxykinase (ATP)